MRGALLVVGVLAFARADAEPELRSPPRWQQASGAPSIARLWGLGGELYGVGASGAFRSADGGATWSPVDGAGPATGVWGSALDDVWIVRARTIHHSHDGKHWATQALPMLSYGAQLEGMWGVERDRYLFGVDRSEGAPRGVILRSRDAGATWRVEDVPELERVAGVWGSDAKDIYAVGSRGVVLHSTGDGAWTIVQQPTGAALEGIWGASAAIVYAVGANGVIVHSADRGKTWTRRLSGATYTLSSITGAGGEILVGSADGPPLRSTDGVTWRPLSAMIGRGVAWSDGSRQLVAASTGVQFFAGAPIAPPPQLPPFVLPPVDAHDTAREAHEATLLAARYGATYPFARDLLTVAATRFGLPRQSTRRIVEVGVPAIRLGQVVGCARNIDTTVQVVPNPNEVGMFISCVKTCSTVMANARIHARDYRGKSLGFVNMSSTVSIRSCNDQEAGARDAVEAVKEEWRKNYRKQLDDRLPANLARVTNAHVRVDILAHYALSGGTDGKALDELATLLGRDKAWSGFVWNPRQRSGCMSEGAVSAAMATADEQLRTGRYGQAMTSYRAIAQCKPEVVPKIYLAACRSKQFKDAWAYFTLLPIENKDVDAQVCIKEGFDPRTGQIVP